MSFIKGTWNDKAELPIPCPKCGHKTHELISKLQATKQCVCAGCGSVIKIDGDGLAALEELKKTIMKFK